MSEYTKGQWVKDGQFSVRLCDCYWVLTQEYCSKKPISVTEREANARLIAAAPEMAKTLKYALDTYSSYFSTAFVVEIERILAKIEGE